MIPTGYPSTDDRPHLRPIVVFVGATRDPPGILSADRGLVNPSGPAPQIWPGRSAIDAEPVPTRRPAVQLAGRAIIQAPSSAATPSRRRRPPAFGSHRTAPGELAHESRPAAIAVSGAATAGTGPAVSCSR